MRNHRLLILFTSYRWLTGGFFFSVKNEHVGLGTSHQQEWKTAKRTEIKT